MRKSSQLQPRVSYQSLSGKAHYRSAEISGKKELEKKVNELSMDEVRKVKYEKKPASTNLIKIMHDSLVNEFLLNDIINYSFHTRYCKIICSPFFFRR